MTECEHHFYFRVMVGDRPAGEVWGPAFKRNWVLWTLSKLCLEHTDHSTVSVHQMINGEWKENNDWSRLGH